MKFSMKKGTMTLVLMFLLVLPSTCELPAFSVESNKPQEALLFIRDVLNLNVEDYNVTLTSHNVDYPDDLDLNSVEREDLTYALKTDESELNVAFIFTNGVLTWCKLYVINGTPVYTQKPVENVLDAAKAFLTQYDAKKDSAYIQQMNDMLDSVIDMKNMEITADNIKFTLSIEENQTNLGWAYTVNGLDFLSKRVSIRFDNGSFVLFKDNWDIYNVGNTNIDISEEEAVKIARELAENYKLEVYKQEGEHVTIDFELSDDPADIKLLTLTRNSTLLYPFWDIDVYFDKVYNNYYAIQVGLWADTGEIAYCNAISGLGGTDSENISTSQLDPYSPATSQLDTSLMYTIGAIGVISILVIIAVKVIRKKEKK